MKMLGKRQSFENYEVNEVKINQKMCVSSVKPNKCRNFNNHHLYALDSNYSIILSLPRKKQARSYYGKNLNTARTYTYLPMNEFMNQVVYIHTATMGWKAFTGAFDAN